jgi:hypothetical protein
MPTPIEIRIVGTDASGAAFDSALGEVERLKSGVNKTNEHLGMNRREWMRTGSEAAYYARTAVASLGEVNKSLGEGIGLATQLGESFMFGGVVGVTVAAVATGLGYLIGQWQLANAEQNKAAEASDKLKKSLAELSEPESNLGKSVKETLGTTSKQSEAIATLASKDDNYRKTLIGVVDLDRQATAAVKERNAAFDRYLTARKNYQDLKLWEQMPSADIDPDNAQKIASEYAAASQAFELYRRNTVQIYADREKAISGLISESEATANLALSVDEANVLHAIAIRQYQTEKEISSGVTKELLDMKSAYDKLATAVGGYLSSAVTSAMKPSAVTPEDMRLSAQGLYKEKWDEPARQLNDIAENGDKVIGKYPQIQKFLKDTGLTAEEAARQYENFALYTTPEGKALYEGTGAKGKLAENAKENIRSMIGTEAMRKEVETELWGTGPGALSDDLKEQLKQMGIQSLSDAEAKKLGLRPEMKVVKAADFNSTLSEITNAITSAIPAEMQTTVHVTYTTSSGGGGASPIPGATGGAENLIGGRIQEFAEGGAGIFTRTGPVFVHAGEPYRIGSDYVGQPITIHLNGAPPSSRYDARKLAREIGKEFQRARG